MITLEDIRATLDGAEIRAENAVIRFNMVFVYLRLPPPINIPLVLKVYPNAVQFTWAAGAVTSIDRVTLLGQMILRCADVIEYIQVNHFSQELHNE